MGNYHSEGCRPCVGLCGRELAGGQPPGFTEDIYATQGRETSQEPGRDHHLQSIQKGVTGKSWPVGVEGKREQKSRSSIAEEPPELPSPGVSFSTEEIGIGTKTRAAPPPETDTYTCRNCKGSLTKGDPECPVCEAGPLDWSGVN